MSRENVTECELLVLKVIWESDKELTLPQIISAVNTKFDKAWKPQTVSTFLSRLVHKNYLTMRRDGRNFMYGATMESNQFGSKVLSDFVDFWLDKNAAQLIPYLELTRKLTASEKEELRTYLLR